MMNVQGLNSDAHFSPPLFFYLTIFPHGLTICVGFEYQSHMHFSALLISNTLSKLNFYHFHVYRSCIVYCFALLVLIFFMYFRLVISHLPNLVVMRACSTVTYVMCFFLVLVENGG